MTREEIALAICRDPADDQLRLAYADFCEETGDVTRAEYVRVQMAIARLESRKAEREAGSLGQEPWEYTDELAKQLEALRRRELELFTFDNISAWFRHEAFLRNTVSQTEFDAAGDVSMQLVRRGFVAAITLPTATFVGGVCDACGGSRYESQIPEAALEDGGCAHCQGTGRVEGHAAAIFRAAPIESVTLSDREPYFSHANFNEGEARWIWFDSDDMDVRPGPQPNHRSHIGRNLFAYLKGGYRRNEHVSEYNSLAEADNALSAACVAHGRKEAKL